MPRIQGRRPPRLEARDRVWVTRMRELAAEQRALDAADEIDEIEDAEFEDYPVRGLARREREVAEQKTNWIPLAVGLGIVALIGVAGVIVYLLVRRKDNGETSVLGAVDPRLLVPPAPAAAPAPQIYVIHAGGGNVTTPSTLAGPESTLPPLAPRPVAYPTQTPTQHKLPAATSQIPATALATAGAHAIEVTLAVVDPIGASAVLAFSPDLTNGVTLLRGGHEQRIRLERYSTLYGKGQTVPVTVSLASTS